MKIVTIHGDGTKMWFMLEGVRIAERDEIGTGMDWTASASPHHRRVAPDRSAVSGLTRASRGCHRSHARLVALETLPEGAVLAAVEGEHRRIGRDAGKCRVDHAARDALALCVARHGGEEAVEVAAAWRRSYGRGD